MNMYCPSFFVDYPVFLGRSIVGPVGSRTRNSSTAIFPVAILYRKYPLSFMNLLLALFRGPVNPTWKP